VVGSWTLNVGLLAGMASLVGLVLLIGGGRGCDIRTTPLARSQQVRWLALGWTLTPLAGQAWAKTAHAIQEIETWV